MITYKDCSFVSENSPVKLGKFAEGFLSEVFPIKDEFHKWEIYEERKKILRVLCPGPEYGLAVKYLVDRLGV